MYRKRMKFFGKYIAALILCIILAVVPVLVSAQDVSVKAALNQRTLTVNRAVALSVTVSGADVSRAGTPEIPDFGEWFTFAGSQGQYSSTVDINGVVSQSITYNYAIIPLKDGSAKIPPVKVRAGGKTFESAELTVEIRAAGAAPPPAQQQARPQGQAVESDNIDVFVVAVPDKRTVYENEGITVDYKVYFGSGVAVSEYSVLNMPNTAGFWTEEYTMKQPSVSVETYNSKRYQAAVLKRVELFPTNSGDYSLDPMQFEFTVRAPNTSGRRNIFDVFDNPLLNRGQKIRVNSSALDIKVNPLPASGRPARFSGAVGSFSLSANVDKRTVKANESVNLTVKISGTGNIRLLNEPVLNITGVHEKYDPQISEKVNRAGGAITGEKAFEYVILPRREGTLRVEPVLFTYFDPEDEMYKTARTSPISINVAPGTISSSGMPRNLTREEVKLIGSDIRFIKESVGEWQEAGGGFFSLMFVTMLMLPLVFIGGAFIYSRHLERLSADIGYKRSRRAGAVASRHLKAARKALGTQDAGKFYPEVARALQDYIADKLNIAAAGIVTGELETVLREKQVDDDLVKEYVNCLQKCDFYRFSSVGGSPEEMQKLFEDSSAAIQNMEFRLKKSA
ncbi:BatD family protein [candidate division KSB1 bacterium]